MRVKLSIVLFILTGLCYSCKAQSLVVKNNDPAILYTGRVAVSDSTTMLSWSATSVKVNFKGTSAKAILQDERGENYFNVIIDGKVSSVLLMAKGKQEYTLASGLKPGAHTLELFKRTEWAMGKTWLYSFQFDINKVKLAAPKPKKRKIEFFGNSITCGYAVEDTTGQDRGSAPYENAYISYASITARHFNADLHSTSKSGIGVVISWFPLIMPEMYDRLDATDPTSKWDFSKFTPDVVVINLFQNDSWLVTNKDFPEFKARFGTTPPTPEYIINKYQDLVKSIRSKYPKANIICALGSMDATREGSVWPGYVEKAVASLGDKKIQTCFFKYKNSPGHPSAKEQEVMAGELISFIEKNIRW